MTRVTLFRVSFCHLLTVHFSLFTASKSTAGLPSLIRRSSFGYEGRELGTGKGAFFNTPMLRKHTVSISKGLSAFSALPSGVHTPAASTLATPPAAVALDGLFEYPVSPF